MLLGVHHGRSRSPLGSPTLSEGEGEREKVDTGSRIPASPTEWSPQMVADWLRGSGQPHAISAADSVLEMHCDGCTLTSICTDNDQEALKELGFTSAVGRHWMLSHWPVQPLMHAPVTKCSPEEREEAQAEYQRSWVDEHIDSKLHRRRDLSPVPDAYGGNSTKWIDALREERQQHADATQPCVGSLPDAFSPESERSSESLKDVNGEDQGSESQEAAIARMDGLAQEAQQHTSGANLALRRLLSAPPLSAHASWGVRDGMVLASSLVCTLCGNKEMTGSGVCDILLEALQALQSLSRRLKVTPMACSTAAACIVYHLSPPSLTA